MSCDAARYDTRQADVYYDLLHYTLFDCIQHYIIRMLCYYIRCCVCMSSILYVMCTTVCYHYVCHLCMLLLLYVITMPYIRLHHSICYYITLHVVFCIILPITLHYTTTYTYIYIYMMLYYTVL